MFKLYFLNTWNSFEDSKPCPWAVVKMNITHKEGHVAKANLTIAKFNLPQAAYLAIFEADNLLFQGRLSGQFEHQNGLTTVDVLSIAPTFEHDLGQLLNSGILAYNPLFFQGKQPKACDHLEAGNHLFYWQRTTGALSLSDYFQGSRWIDLGGNYLEGSLKTCQINLPLGKVVVHLNVGWTQSLEGSFNAAPYIAKAFSNCVIATLTPQSLTNHWPKVDQRLGIGRRQSGYQVERSSLTPVGSIQTIGGRLASHTKPYWQKNGALEKTMRCKIHYFKADLKINWRYHQAREEKLTLQGVLNHQQHLFTQHKVRNTAIAVHLPNRYQALFFETSQGKDFITYARKIARCQLKASARCMRTVCKLPWDLGRNLTVDDSLKLKAPEIGQADILGKITQLRLVVEGLQRFVEVTLGCVIAKGDHQAITQAIEPQTYGQESWDDAIYSTDGLKGITHLNFNPKDLMQSISVKNSAAKQENHLSLNQFPVRDNLAQALSEVPTSIHLILRDLRTIQPLVRNFTSTLPLIDPPLTEEESDASL